MTRIGARRCIGVPDRYGLPVNGVSLAQTSDFVVLPSSIKARGPDAPSGLQP